MDIIQFSSANTNVTSYIANGVKQKARTLPKLLQWQYTFGVFSYVLPLQNMTSYSYSATPISYKGDEISRLSRLVFEIWCGTDRRQMRWLFDKTLICIVCEPNKNTKNTHKHVKKLRNSDNTLQWWTQPAAHHAALYPTPPWMLAKKPSDLLLLLLAITLMPFHTQSSTKKTKWKSHSVTDIEQLNMELKIHSCQLLHEVELCNALFHSQHIIKKEIYAQRAQTSADPDFGLWTPRSKAWSGSLPKLYHLVLEPCPTPPKNFIKIRSQVCKLSDGQTDKQTDRQTDKQTELKT